MEFKKLCDLKIGDIVYRSNIFSVRYQHKSEKIEIIEYVVTDITQSGSLINIKFSKKSDSSLSTKFSLDATCPECCNRSYISSFFTTKNELVDFIKKSLKEYKKELEDEIKKSQAKLEHINKAYSLFLLEHFSDKENIAREPAKIGKVFIDGELYADYSQKISD